MNWNKSRVHVHGTAKQKKARVRLSDPLPIQYYFLFCGAAASYQRDGLLSLLPPPDPPPDPPPESLFGRASLTLRLRPL